MYYQAVPWGTVNDTGEPIGRVPPGPADWSLPVLLGWRVGWLAALEGLPIGRPSAAL